ncbi:unnamed protein product [Protopolystoma xenopodis]|uniref:Uncharacterized protein n=1 Tax=Protopolystoma xenopodis TaxID=117903 RepID=A0A3S5FEM6_9PLAT|nr:unnamed protein product [Protopolystoma xenopodis]
MVACFFIYVLWNSLVERDLVIGRFRKTGSIVNVMFWPMTFHTVFHRKSVETSFVVNMEHQ